MTESRCHRIAESVDAGGLLLRARAALEHAETLNPRNKDRAANLAEIGVLLHRRTGDRRHLEDALRWFERAALIAPNDVTIAAHHAAALVEAGPEQFPTAEAILRRSLELDPTFDETHLVLGDLLLACHRTSEAGASYARVLRDNPSLLGEPDGARFVRIVHELRVDADARARVEHALVSYSTAMTEQLVVVTDRDERTLVLDEIERAEKMLAVMRRAP